MKKTNQLKKYEGNLTPFEAATGIQAARLNALDLVVTSELLYNRKRYAHSTAIATLSIEEAGKVPILLSIFLGLGQPTKKLWQDYRRHIAKTKTLNVGIESRIAVFFPEIEKETKNHIANNGPNSSDLEVNKQLSLYSDCFETKEGVTWHVPQNTEWQKHAWERLNEAKALAHGLRDYSPEELAVWLQYAQKAKAENKQFSEMLKPLHDELLKKEFIKEGWWNPIFKFLEELK
jgi:AbiV family abortive infection protein